MTLPKEHMKHALKLAKKGIYSVAPNPMVGCIIVKDDQVIGEGWHVKSGHNHAEINAIEDVKRKHGSTSKELLQGSEVFVTLEPCSTTGRTPPCCEALIKAGIKKVYIAQEDTSQEGLESLRAANIEVETGLLNDKAITLNTGFFTRINEGRPFVTCKIACSLDGGIALSNGESKWITCEKSRRDAHQIRATSDAILTGIGTVLADDPSLTARIENQNFIDHGNHPLRCVVDSSLQITGKEKVLTDGHPTIIFTNQLITKFDGDNLTVIAKPGDNNKVSLKETLRHLGQMGINNLMLEAGPTLVDAMIAEELIDKFIFYMAPKILGAGKLNFSKLEGSIKNLGTIVLEIEEVEVIGDDLKLAMTPEY
jgi:diaminohydroxyphosphoribosylaminopyrimidine deaminase/5-amino-6-(5-phosphoribosylamino)uracil reductase